MSENSNLLSRGINAAKWNYLGSGIKVLLQFLIGVWLARLLGPEAFGVVAVAWLMIAFGKLISDFGFSAALIQRPDLTDQDVGFVFAVQVLIGLALSLLSFVFASQIAAFFNHPPAEPVIAVMAWLFLIQAIGQTTTAALNRALRSKFSQVVSVATYLLGYVGVGVPMAYLGYGVWSLVAAQITQAFAYTVVVLVKSGVVIRPQLRPSKPGLFTFGVKVIGANLLYYVNQNLDNFIVARAFGVAQLGIYNRAMTLLSTPNGVLVSNLHAVLFAMASREQGNPNAIKQNLLAATEFIGLTSLPIFCVVAVAPDAVILGVYGEGWRAAISLVVPLALAMPVYACLTVIGPVLMAVNRTELESYAQLSALLISAPILLVAGMQSLEALSWAVLLAYFIRWITLVLAARIAIKVTLFEMLKALRSGLALALPVTSTVMAFDHLIVVSNPTMKLLFLISTAGSSLLIWLRVLGPFVAQGVMLQLLLERNALPATARFWLRLR